MVETARAGSHIEGRAGQPGILYLRGEFDVANTHDLRVAIERAALQADVVVLDMTDTTFIDASVIGVLVSAEAGLAGGLRVRGATGMVAKVFSLVDMEHLLDA